MPEARAHPHLVIQAAGAADIGRTRAHNEDAVLVRPDLRLYLVADGAGGHNAGNVASALAIASITDHFESTERAYRAQPDVDRFGIPTGARRIASAILKANRDVVEISRSAKKYGGMGSTIVAAVVAERSPALHVAHVGDSRCYRLRSGRLERLTHDHALLNDVLETHPDLGEEVLAKLPRNVVTRALGMEEAVRVTVRSFEIAPEDVYLLCSDGLTTELADEAIRRVLTLPEPPAELVERLIRMANDAGGRDNVTALVLAFDAAPEASTTELAPELEPDPVPFPPFASSPPFHTPPAPRERLASAPEILLLGIESDIDPEEAPVIRTVPVDSASADLIEALGSLLHKQRNASCATCGEPLADSLFCPRCGMRRQDG